MDGDTASDEDTLVTLEIWASHFLRRDKFKVGCSGKDCIRGARHVADECML